MAPKTFSTKGLIITAANVGSFGSYNPELKPENIKVRANTINFLTRVAKTYGKVDAFLAQETNTDNYENFNFTPILKNAPVATNKEATYGADDGGKRGVAIWANQSEEFKETDNRILEQLPKDEINEITTTILRYKNRKLRSIPIAIINCYRNQHRIYERSEEDTKKAIMKICGELRNLGVKSHLIAGDFNNQNFRLNNNYREIKSPKLYHKHNNQCQKTFIDKIFTNTLNAGLLEVQPTLENTNYPSDQNPNSNTLGHKAYVLWAGSPPTPAEIIYSSACNPKNLRTASKDCEDEQIPKIPEPDTRSLIEIENHKEFIDKMSIQFNNMLKLLVKRASKPIKKTAGKRNDLVIWDQIEKTANYQNACERPWHALYAFTSSTKEDLETEEDPSKPPLKDLVKNLETKFTELREEEKATNNGTNLMDEYVRNQFPINYSKKGTFYKCKKKFKSLILDVSNSGAIDRDGISLKQVKAILGSNSRIRDVYQNLSEWCFVTGYFPECWKNDDIFFIWKRKGKKSDPKMYRPITIASSIGKCLEKQIAHYLSNITNNNKQNHAYIKKRSCLTAITDVQKLLLKISNPLEDKNLGADQYIDIPIISTDDISSAFESVPHQAVCEAVKRDYQGDNRYKVSQLLQSYLIRNINATDRTTHERIKVEKKFQNKSIPQGSIISPLLWRIFDGLFTGYYNKLLYEFSKQNDHLKRADNRSFADDHLTPSWLRIPKSSSQALIGLIIKCTLKATRSLIIIATEKFGCGCNPSKSENIVPPQYHQAVKLIDKKFEVKSEFKWLGYVLILNNKGQLKFDIKYAENKLILARKERDSIYQYTNNIIIRHSFYRSYMAPCTEWFMPIVIQQPDKDNTIIHKFQRDCLSKIAGVHYTAPAKECEAILGEMPIKNKALRVANRIVENCGTKEAEKRAMEKSETETQVRVTRAKTREITAINSMKSGAKENIIFRLNYFSSLQLEEFVKTKPDYTEVKKWAKSTNLKINNQIKLRTRSSI